MLTLASIYKIDPEELQGESGALLVAMKKVFSDPLLSGELPGEHEIVEVVI